MDMPKTIINKTIQILLLLLICVSCTKTEEVHVQPVKSEGGEDSGGGNTSFASSEQIEFVFNELTANSEAIFKVLLDVSKEQKFDLPSKDFDLIKYINKIKYELNSKNCDSNKDNVICISIAENKEITKGSLYEVVSILIIGNTYKKLGADNLQVPILEIFVRRNINEILERVFIKSTFQKDLHTLIQEVSQEVLFLQKLKLSGYSYDAEACKSLSRMTALINRLENEAEFIKESEDNGLDVENVKEVNLLFMSYYKQSCIFSRKIQSQELLLNIQKVEGIVNNLKKGNYLR